MLVDNNYLCLNEDGDIMDRLKELREDHDLLQKEIAKVLGITQRNYSYFETGTTLLTEDILKKLAKFYNVSVDYLLYQTDERKRYPESIVEPEDEQQINPSTKQ